MLISFLVVIKERKSKVWKQITTVTERTKSSFLLLSKNVNLKFESKSQQQASTLAGNSSCYQRT